mgnify:FL=1
MKRDLRENLLKYNDYELLYMNGLSSEEARDILFEKYMFMIKKMIVKFNVQPNEKDDYFQEGLIALNKAIKTYKETSNMTFTRFVEMLIYHRFVDLTRIKKNVMKKMFHLMLLTILFQSQNLHQCFMKVMYLNF